MSREAFVLSEEDAPMGIAQLIHGLQKALKLYGDAPVFLRCETDVLQGLLLVSGATFAAEDVSNPNFKGVVLSAISAEPCPGCDLCRTGMQH